MKIRSIATAITVAVAGCICQAQQPLTLNDCLAIALSDNPTVKVADMEIQRMDYSRKSTLAQLLPQISFGGSYSRMLAKQVMYMNMDAFAGMGGDGAEVTPDDAPAADEKKDNGIKMGLDNSYSVGFNASLPLIAPQLWKSLKLSDSQILQSVEQARSGRLELINQVKSAYYSLLLAEDSRKVIQESYDMASFTHDLYAKKYAAGAASDYDVLRTSVAMKNIEPELKQADIAIKRARLQLLILMGVDAEFPLVVTDRLSNYESIMAGKSRLLSRDASNNPQLVMNTLQTKTLRDALDVQRMAWCPTLSFSANYNWTSMSNGNPFRNFHWNPYSTVGLTLSLPIFTGGSRYSNVKQAEVQVKEMELQRENLERSVNMQVSLAIDNINVNEQQIESCAESVGQATRAHDIMEKSFAIGAASYLDLRDSELALTQSRLAYYQAIYNYLIANSELELLLGNAPTEAAAYSANR